MNDKKNISNNFILNTIDITPLLKAQKKFDEFRQQLDTEQKKAGAVQAFEYSFELCWKMLKRILEVKGMTAPSARDAFRIGAQNNYIVNPEVWFDFLSKRNLTSHVYDENIMADVLIVFPAFSEHMAQLIKALQATK